MEETRCDGVGTWVGWEFKECMPRSLEGNSFVDIRKIV